ncbi:hypothetical protein L1887_57893 [Cichorium endivia]|nr:hypothetical protein L1887_57893 [Cichorium endivia]
MPLDSDPDRMRICMARAHAGSSKGPRSNSTACTISQCTRKQIGLEDHRDITLGCLPIRFGISADKKVGAAPGQASWQSDFLRPWRAFTQARGFIRICLGANIQARLVGSEVEPPIHSDPLSAEEESATVDG